MKKNDTILLGHGSGGKLTHDLIDQLFARYFDNPILRQQGDSALLEVTSGKLAFTTDSFVVDPVFFPGGNIGHLAIAGTVNDLSVSGAIPQYLSAGFIIEEGFSIASLEIIVKTMAEEAHKAGVSIVTGDTKVVDRGKCDKLFINTSGIGQLCPENEHISGGSTIRPGDKIIINGSIGDHGMAIMAARKELNISTKIESDCASLNSLIHESIQGCKDIRFMRDATRGGLGTVVAELTKGRSFGLRLDETKIKVQDNVRGLCEMLGFDPLYVANEGKVLVVVGPEESELVVSRMKQHPLGIDAAIIGEITSDHQGTAWLETVVGGKRIIDMLSGNQLPRIC
ncbi:MAG: hydrogenase expression/formation protein HypE [Bacteroidales bacterium]|jgi:hydrogenase expression/formation protein HypE